MLPSILNIWCFNVKFLNFTRLWLHIGLFLLTIHGSLKQCKLSESYHFSYYLNSYFITFFIFHFYIYYYFLEVLYIPGISEWVIHVWFFVIIFIFILIISLSSRRIVNWYNLLIQLFKECNCLFTVRTKFFFFKTCF